MLRTATVQALALGVLLHAGSRSRESFARESRLGRRHRLAAPGPARIDSSGCEHPHRNADEKVVDVLSMSAATTAGLLERDLRL